MCRVFFPVAYAAAGFPVDKDELSGGIAPGGINVRWLVPERYADPNTSGLSVEVLPGMATLQLTLTSKAA